MTPQAARHAAAPMQQFGLLAATIRLSYLSSLARYQTVAAGPVGPGPCHRLRELALHQLKAEHHRSDARLKQWYIPRLPGKRPSR